VAAWQEERLGRIVRLAYGHTRYYRETFDAIGLRPEDVRTLDDLRLVPMTPKEAVKERPGDFLTSASPRRGWLHGHTSGTTGTPLSLWYDRETCIATNAVDRQHKWWGGAGPGEWVGLLLGRTIVPPRRSTPPFWRANHVQRQLWLSSFHLRDEWLPLYAAELRRRGIRFLEGYPSTLYILARHLLRAGERLQLTAAFSSSETLHHVQREAIEEAFQCRLFDYYGSAERVVYAAECEAHAGKHVAEEYGIVEIVDVRGTPVPEG
jgi:phenylacetate-CoA ligase